MRGYENQTRGNKIIPNEIQNPEMQLRWYKSHDFTEEELGSYNISICPICLKYAPTEQGDPILMALHYKHPFKMSFHHDCACLTDPAKIHERFMSLNHLRVYSPTKFTFFRGQTVSKERLRVYINLEVLHPLFSKKLFQKVFSEDFIMDKKGQSWKKMIQVSNSLSGLFDQNIPFIPSNFFVLNFEVDVPVYRKVYRRKVLVNMEQYRSQGNLENYGVKLLQVNLND